MHLIIEKVLEVVAMKFLPQIFSKITLLFYDIIHGVVSCYNMRDILDFWKGRL